MADAKLVKELRERTGAGFLDVKKALEATNDNIEQAIEWLQEKGAAKAAKKAGNIAAEGVVAIANDGTNWVLYEVNSQTDFVAQNQEFVQLVELIGQTLVSNSFTNIEEANAIVASTGKSIKDITIDATAKIGEKIELRRALKVTKQSNQSLGAYVHTNKQVAAIVVTQGGSDEVARNVAMHVASMNPQYLDASQVPANKLQALKEEIASSEDLLKKPENLRSTIAEGLLRKQLSELTLVDQEFVMEKLPVSKYLSNHGAVAIESLRFEVGEGIEKHEVDFAAEVAAQMAK